MLKRIWNKLKSKVKPAKKKPTGAPTQEPTRDVTYEYFLGLCNDSDRSQSLTQPPTHIEYPPPYTDLSRDIGIDAGYDAGISGGCSFDSPSSD